MAHILVIDDNQEVRSLFELFLQRCGYVVSMAADGREGLQQQQQKKADLVITDIYMPEVDGLEVILALKKQSLTDGRDIPVIAMSGDIFSSNALPSAILKQAKLFGASRIFSKPIDFNGMHHAIQELLPATV